MELLIDDANLTKINVIIDIFPIDGVITDSSILSKNGVEPFIMLK